MELARMELIPEVISVLSVSRSRIKMTYIFEGKNSMMQWCHTASRSSHLF